MSRRLLYLLLIASLIIGLPASVFAQAPTPGAPSVDVSGLVVTEQDITEPFVARELRTMQGPVQLVVQLRDKPVAAAVGPNAKQRGAALTPAAQRNLAASLNGKQQALMNQIAALGGKELGRLNKSLNAVIVEVDAAAVPKIAAMAGVSSIRPVGTYEKHLGETVPYIGATAVQAMGYDGAGVDVAVLDSGIDYLHYNLGGAGSVDEFNANDPTVIEPGTFPTAKVVGGYDFVGEVWPNGPTAPDADPLDKGVGAGHGTHVADIIAGKSADGLHKGVAPGANLYAVGVCSKVSSSCNGVALLQGMDFALDPNGDNDISDAVDVINMSLGSSYGQREDDLSAASANAVALGVVVVASAGNSSDKPYIVGSPSSTPEVISVAQTQVPSAKLYKIDVAGTVVGGSWQPWSAAPVAVTAPLQYGNGAGGNLLACSAYPAGSLAGKVLLVDRGACSISIKVSNGAAGGALAVIIANNAAQAPGDLPPDFSFGGGDPSVAGYTITRADGALIKPLAGQTVTIDPAQAASLVGNMVSSSSRGPGFSYNWIKPDIGAPGASLSAQYGTGNGETAFGGTSGAAPMVSGAAALVIQKFAGSTPQEVKARLTNTAETNIGINPVALPGYPAPITRIGGGEVRVDKAVAAGAAAWESRDLTGNLSFGYHTLFTKKTLTKVMVLRNYENRARLFTITPTFRYPDDAASGAVTVVAPGAVTVPANGSRNVTVQLRIDPSKLPVWDLNGGARGGDGYRLQGVEFDGYIVATEGADTIRMPWQVLPHRAANTRPSSLNPRLTNGAATINLTNGAGAVDGRTDVFALLGSSPRIPRSQLPGNGDNFAVIDLKLFGARMINSGGTDFIQFAVNTWGTRAHPNYPAEFDVYLDTDRNGADDFVLYNLENGGFGATGQNVVVYVNLNTGASGVVTFIDADLNSGNAILSAPMSALGLTPGTTFDVSVYAFDNYFTGSLTDAITGMTFTAGAPKYAVDNWTPVAPAGGSVPLKITAVPGGDTASPSQTGLLLMYRDAMQQREADPVVVR